MLKNVLSYSSSKTWTTFNEPLTFVGAATGRASWRRSKFRSIGMCCWRLRDGPTAAHHVF